VSWSRTKHDNTFSVFKVHFFLLLLNEHVPLQKGNNCGTDDLAQAVSGWGAPDLHKCPQYARSVHKLRSVIHMQIVGKRLGSVLHVLTGWDKQGLELAAKHVDVDTNTHTAFSAPLMHGFKHNLDIAEQVRSEQQLACARC